MKIDSSRRKFASLAFTLPWASGLLKTSAPAHPAPPPAAAEIPGAYYNVQNFGAVGDGSQLETYVLQTAIDAAAAAGGGVVYFPAGVYLSGTLFFRSGVTLHLAEGSKLLGSPNLSDYPPMIPEFRSYADNYAERSLLYGEKVERIGITGRGVIDGSGEAFPNHSYKHRPYILRLVQCRDISVTEVTLQNSPMWVQHYLACEDLQIRGIKVRDRSNCCTSNHDGLDLDSCQRVRISDCDINSEDDALVFKSTSPLPCKDVVVTNCILSSKINALKFGTETVGGFENINISNLSIYDTRLAGLALEIVDGGTMDRVTITNVTMRDTGCPIFIRLGDRGRPYQSGLPKPPAGKLRNIIISNVQATGATDWGCSVTGIPDAHVENITLENISIAAQGGGPREWARRQIPEQIDRYPECTVFGKLPAYGFFARHVNKLTMRNIQLSYTNPDFRHALVCDDITNLNLSGIQGMGQNDGASLIRFDHVKGAWLQACHAATRTPTLLELNGDQSSGIKLLGNDLSNVAREVELSREVASDRIQSCGCRALPPVRQVN
jgi:hypothetical protein